MGKYNFDRYIERRGTESSKWDGFESRFPGYNASGALPMWVADMDFTAPDEVIEVLKKKAAFGIYGYPAPSMSHRNASKSAGFFASASPMARRSLCCADGGRSPIHWP